MREKLIEALKGAGIAEVKMMDGSLADAHDWIQFVDRDGHFVRFSEQELADLLA